MKRKTVNYLHPWREGLPCLGQRIFWDTFERNWLGIHGEAKYLIHLIDDATNRLFARFVRQDSTSDNMAVLSQYIQLYGRPQEFCTNESSLFYTAPKKNFPDPGQQLPPTQLRRALEELEIQWRPAASPRAKARTERRFRIAHDRLVRDLRLAGVKKLDQANQFLEDIYLPEWNAHHALAPASMRDAHRALGKQHLLDAILCRVEERVVTNQRLIRVDGQTYRIESSEAGLPGARVRVERRVPEGIAVRFGRRYLSITPYEPGEQPKTSNRPKPKTGNSADPNARRKWMTDFWQRPSPPLHKIIALTNSNS